MKKNLKTSISVIVVILALVYLATRLGILDFSKISDEELLKYSGHYYEQLSKEQQQIYVKIAKAVEEKEEVVRVGKVTFNNADDVFNDIMMAYFYDNPKIFDLSNQYIIVTKDFKFIKNYQLKLKYFTDNKYKFAEKEEQLEKVIDSMLKNVINDNMTDYEKELAIHDAIVNRVEYYEYEDINDIPSIKHTAYGALVEKQAVCDGMAKAFKILLDEAGIENIIVSGTAENVSHAWNMVKIDDEYYNVDITSNDITDKNKRYVMHAYFNITDDSIKTTHKLDKSFKYPECYATKYDYYKQQNMYLSYDVSTYSQLSEIIDASSSDVLEIKVDDRYYVQSIIDTLYDLNFAGWKTQGKEKITYNKIRDVYIFLK